MLALLLSLLLAVGAEPASLTWAGLPAAAEAAFDAGVGAASAHRREGFDAARRAEPLPFQSIFVQLEPDPRPGAQPLEGLQAALNLGLGDRRGRRRALWTAEEEAEAARAEEARWLLEERLTDAFLEWWLADAMRDHFTEHAGEMDGWLAPLEQAVTSGSVAPAEVADLNAELARLRAEIADADYAEAVARSALDTLVVHHVEPSRDGLPELAEADSGTNPWRDLAARLDDHPTLRRLEAEAAVADAREAAERWATPAQVGLGVSIRATPDGAPSPVPLVLLTVPLTNPQAPEARVAAAEAAGRRSDLAWQRTRLEAWVRGEALALDAALSRWRALGASVEGPLRERVERLEAGLLAGVVPASLVVLARRDLHEAFHERALAAAEVHRRRARARALARRITVEETP